MEAAGLGLVHKEDMAQNVQIWNYGVGAELGLRISCGGHGVNGHVEVTGVGCGPGLALPKEIQPVHSKGDQPWVFFGRNDAKAETPVLWPPHAKS